MRLRTRDLPVFPVSSGGPAHHVQTAGGAPSHIGPGQLTAADHAESPRLGVVTLGCDKNTVDSEHMTAALVSAGGRVVEDVETADVLVVNTCGFIEAAKEESIDAILEACALKENGRVKAVAAVGCLVQRHQRELEQEIPEVDLFLGIAEMGRLVPELRERRLLPERFVPTMERPLRMLSARSRHSTFLKISEGCDHTCAFCAIPHMRGLHRSAPLPELVEEARALGDAGVRELNLVSQDTTWYGRDLRRRDRSAPLLPDLLTALLDGTDVEWFRLFYMYPSGITPEMTAQIAQEPRVLPYLDMPLQHGSDRMLQRMRRPERQATIRERVGRLRDRIDDLTLRTTVVVGFPGETEDDFAMLLDLLEELRFDRVGAFAYSLEEGTAAAEMPDQVPDELKAERLERLEDHQRGLSWESNLAMVGRRLPVLVEEAMPEREGTRETARASAGDEEASTWNEDERLAGGGRDATFAGADAVGRTWGQGPEVDGRTHLVGAPGARPGEIVVAEIVAADEHDLEGTLIDRAGAARSRPAPPSGPRRPGSS